MIVPRAFSVGKGRVRNQRESKERAEDCEEMNNITDADAPDLDRPAELFGRKQGPGARNPLANAATSLATTENKQWASPRNYSIVIICNSYQRATMCLLSAAGYHFTSRVTLFRMDSFNATPGSKQIVLLG
jgi:hypothetical protein